MIYVSVVSLLEIAVKRARHRGAVGISAAEARARVQSAGSRLLPVTAPHVVEVERLPPIHGDPFDRLLAAQALAEGLPLVTRDKLLASYSDLFILA